MSNYIGQKYNWPSRWHECLLKLLRYQWTTDIDEHLQQVIKTVECEARIN